MRECSLESCFLLELCAGTAGFTAAARLEGFRDSFGIDHVRPSRCKGPIVCLDLTNSDDQSLVLEWLENPLCRGVLLAPPCGTARAARNIRLPHEFGGGPPPLRSTAEPDGMYVLSPKYRQRVGQANKIFAFVKDVVEKATALGKPAVVENPSNSLFWLSTFWTTLTCSREMGYQAHHACAYGGRRPKQTTLAFNREVFHGINGVCPGDHEHLAWGKSSGQWATSLEAQYPPGLCKALVRCFLKCAQHDGITMPPSSLHELSISSRDFLQAVRVMMHEPVKQSKLPRLVPEFKQVVTIFGPSGSLPASTVRRRLESQWPLQSDVVCSDATFVVLPEGAQLLRHTVKKGESQCEDDSRPCEQAWGIPFGKIEFFKETLEKGHPRCRSAFLPEPLRRAIDFSIEATDAEIVESRAAWFKKWVARARALQEDEADMKSKMDPEIKRVVETKRILLFKEILHDLDYPDRDVWKLLRDGVKLHGDIEKSNVFPQKLRPATLTPEALRKIAPAVNHANLKHVGPSDDKELDEAMWQKTEEEEAAGWITTPVSIGEIPKDYPLARRFALKQKKGKIRLIDDFSCSLTNSTTTCHEKSVLDTIDVLSSSMMYMFQRCKSEGLKPNLCVKTVDLKSAYKQVPVAVESEPFAYVAAYSPKHKEKMAFRCTAMPFGGSASVPGFLRLARAIWYIATVALKIITTNFFDDYVIVSESSVAHNTNQSFESLLSLLGWKFDASGPKATKFGKMADALGITIDFSESREYKMKLRNTVSRREEIIAMIDEVVVLGELSRVKALQLRGRMGFAESQVFGRTARQAMHSLVDHAYYGGGGCVSASLLRDLKALRDFVEKGEDRELTVASKENFVLLTDASYEEGRACVGGVLVGPSGTLLEYFSHELSKQQTKALGSEEKDTIIFECEILALVVGFELWERILAQRQVIMCLDNDAARFTILAGYGRSTVSERLVKRFVCLEESSRAHIWIARVPSPSNLADLPSRLECEYLEHKGCVRKRANIEWLVDENHHLPVGRSVPGATNREGEELVSPKRSRPDIGLKQMLRSVWLKQLPESQEV